MQENTQIQKISAADQVCDRVKQKIRAGEWNIGDRLPAESELAAMFGVNRLTVRIALQKLNALGVLETKNGSGTFVVPFSFDDYIQEVSDFYMEPSLLENVCEFRKTVEIECVRLAIERGTEEEFAELERCMEKLHKAIDSPPKQSSAEEKKEYCRKLAELDLAFHRKICEMAHNKLYLYSFIVAQSSIFQYVLLLNWQRVESHHGGTGDPHPEIVRAMREKDFEACKKSYIRMVDHKNEW